MKLQWSDLSSKLTPSPSVTRGGGSQSTSLRQLSQGTTITPVAMLSPAPEALYTVYLEDFWVVALYKYAGNECNAEKRWESSEKLFGKTFEVGDRNA